jgi:hypothetical protein
VEFMSIQGLKGDLPPAFPKEGATKSPMPQTLIVKSGPLGGLRFVFTLGNVGVCEEIVSDPDSEMRPETLAGAAPPGRFPGKAPPRTR